jgi:small subunit ribosomal protein S20
LRKNLSQLKRQRQDEKRKLRNRALRSEMRTTLRKAREAVADKPAAEETLSLVAKANRTIDTMVTKGVIHKNTAGRYQSRLARNYLKKNPPAKKQAPAGTPAETPDSAKTGL